MHVLAGLFPSSWTGNTPLKLPFAANLIVYLIIIAICLTILGLVFRYNRRVGRTTRTWRWTTQDIIVIAILGVLLEVYDNLIGDQFITPLIQGIPFTHAFAVNDLPYMFLLMTGIAIVRKPGSATALVFLNFLLMQLLYGGSESSPLFWPYGLLQGVFVDLYLLSRRGKALSRPGWAAVGDGLVMGALRAFPAVTAQSAVISPLLDGQTQTGAYILLYSVFNLIGNGLEAGITAPLALRVARTVNPGAGYDEADEVNEMDEMDEMDETDAVDKPGAVNETDEVDETNAVKEADSGRLSLGTSSIATPSGEEPE
jgi:hypothetical protein